MNFLKKHWLTLVLSLFVIIFPWQTRYIFGVATIGNAPSQFGVMSLYVSEVLLTAALVIGTALFGQLRTQKKYQPFILFVLGLTAFIFLSSTWSVSPHLSLMTGFHCLIALLFFTALLDERANPRYIGLAFALGLLPPVFIGIAQVFTGSSIASTVLGLASRNAETLGDAVIMVHGERVLRAYGSFPHPNVFGGYLAIGIIASIASWKAFLTQAKSRRAIHAAFAVLTTLLALGLLLTASRSAVFGLFVGLLLGLIVYRVKNVRLARKIVLPLCFVLIALVLAVTNLAPSLVQKVRGGGALEQKSLEERADQYGEFPVVVHGADWLIGNGAGAYVYALAGEEPGQDVWVYQPIHNVPLLLIGEIGLIGLLMVLFILSRLLIVNFSRLSAIDAIAAFSMSSALITISFFDHYLWSSFAGLALVALVFALLVRSTSFSD